MVALQMNGKRCRGMLSFEKLNSLVSVLSSFSWSLFSVLQFFVHFGFCHKHL